MVASRQRHLGRNARGFGVLERGVGWEEGRGVEGGSGVPPVLHLGPDHHGGQGLHQPPPVGRRGEGEGRGGHGQDLLPAPHQLGEGGEDGAIPGAEPAPSW